jgi:hypothetical protein
LPKELLMVEEVLKVFAASMKAKANIGRLGSKE